MLKKAAILCEYESYLYIDSTVSCRGAVISLQRSIDSAESRLENTKSAKIAAD